MSDDILLRALSQALDADPGNAVLRMHLAQLLLDAGRGEVALSHHSAVLTDEPDSADALKGAAAAAEAAGQAEKASGYRRLLSALEAGDKSEDESLAQSTGKTESGEETNVVKLRVVGRDEEVRAAEVEPPSVTWNDIGGMEQVKRRLEVAFLGPMRNPELRDAYKMSLRGGLNTPRSSRPHMPSLEDVGTRRADSFSDGPDPSGFIKDEHGMAPLPPNPRQKQPNNEKARHGNGACGEREG